MASVLVWTFPMIFVSELTNSFFFLRLFYHANLDLLYVVFFEVLTMRSPSLGNVDGSVI